MFGRKGIFVSLSLAAILAAGLVASPALADTEGHGEQHVYVIVDSNITIGGLVSDPYGNSESNGNNIAMVDLGRVQTGLICGAIRWRVDANTEAVRFCLAASDLWKGDDPIGATVPPIPVYTENGVEFDIEYGNPVFGQDGTVLFNGQTTIGDFPAMSTEYVTFESSQNGHFSQYVITRLCWYQDDPEKPTGQYSGVVALWGFVVPSL